MQFKILRPFKSILYLPFLYYYELYDILKLTTRLDLLSQPRRPLLKHLLQFSFSFKCLNDLITALLEHFRLIKHHSIQLLKHRLQEP